jgi:PAS domain S-box-containing protein
MTPLGIRLRFQAVELRVMGMSEAPCDLAGLDDPRLALHATRAAPVWLWSVDGTRVLWANAAGAALFGTNPRDLPARRFPPDAATASQIARLAATLSPGGEPRLYRLRGFGGALGRPLTCACARIPYDQDAGILVGALESAVPALPLAERVRRLYDGADDAVHAAFAADGNLLFATTAARQRLHGATSLAEVQAEALAAQALETGRASGESGLGRTVLRRLGSGADTVLAATFESAPAQAAASPSPAPLPPSPASVEPLPETPTPANAQEPERADAGRDAPVQAATEAEAARPLLRIEVPLSERRYPLRFVWQMDEQERFTLGSDEFTEVIGPRIAVALGRPWQDVAAELGLDPDGAVLRAVASRETWSGITVSWPIDGSDERLAVELSGLPIYARDRTFLGYRGFGVCRDIARIARLSRIRRPPVFTADPPVRRQEASGPAAAIRSDQAAQPQEPPAPVPEQPAPPPDLAVPAPEQPAENARPSLSLVPPAENVVPFRAGAEGKPAPSPQAKSPALSPGEHNAFRELARQLSARLNGEEDAAGAPPEVAQTHGSPLRPVNEQRRTAWDEGLVQDAGLTASEEPAGAPLPSGLLDRLPVGLLVYRFEQLLYANRAFLDATGYASLDDLTAAGGLDSLFIAGDADDLAEPGEAGQPLAILTQTGDKMPVAARLFSMPWNGDKAMVLMLTGSAPEDRPKAADDALRAAEAQIRELRSILDVATDGVIVLDREGRILSSNRSAEALFGYDASELSARSFPDLFSADSRGAILDRLARLAAGGVASLNDGREVTGLVRQGGRIPLFMTLGPATDTPDRFCAVFRDLTPWKKAEQDRDALRSQAEQASAAKAEFLAKISHEVRTPLNSILGFAEIMLEEKFGPIGNERYRDYLKDIRESGAHIAALLHDMLDLSKVEAGKLELTFVPVDLNEIAQACVRTMQPQANSERIIIRTSLSPNLRPIVADARSLQQIISNLLANAIKFAGPGGQVIVSTGVTDKGGVVLRVRDTGTGMSGKELETAMAPFRPAATAAPGANGGDVGLPLTKALAEANRGTFHIVSKVNDGTLVEIAFPPTRIPAE